MKLDILRWWKYCTKNGADLYWSGSGKNVSQNYLPDGVPSAGDGGESDLV